MYCDGSIRALELESRAVVVVPCAAADCEAELESAGEGMAEKREKGEPGPKDGARVRAPAVAEGPEATRAVTGQSCATTSQCTVRTRAELEAEPTHRAT